MGIRFTAGQQRTFEPFEAGVYDFRIESAEQSVNKKGNPQLTVKCTIVGGRYDGKPYTEWYSLLDNSMWKLNNLVAATGCNHVVEGTDAKGNPIISFEESDLVGLVFAGDLTIDEYQGTKRNRLNNERQSELADFDAPEEQQAAPAPTPAPAKPAVTTSSMPARRPRTVQAG